VAASLSASEATLTATAFCSASRLALICFSRPAVAGDGPEAVGLDFAQPQRARRRLRGTGGQAPGNEADGRACGRGGMPATLATAAD
jgi:hypothetical protein